MAGLPLVKVELDNGAGAWPYDISAYVDLQNGFTLSRGRGDQYDAVDPSQLSLRLKNDGRFTLGDPTYNVYVDQPIRLSLTSEGNYLTANQSSFETSVTWTAGGTVVPTLSSSTTHPYDGTKGMLITWGTAGTLPRALTTVTGLTIGRTYTLSAYVWVPTGSPNVVMAVSGISIGSASSIKDAHTRITYTFVATATSHSVQVWPATAPTSGNQCWVDAVMVNDGPVADEFTTLQPVTYTRFTGFVQDWPVTWDSPTAPSAFCSVQAVDRLARLARRQLRSMLENEIIADAPMAYYTLAEGEGATSAGDSSGNGAPPLGIAGSGADIVFGNGTGPGTDGLSAAQFAGGKYLRSTPGGTVDDMGCFFRRDGAPATAEIVLASGGSAFVIETNGRGSFYAIGFLMGQTATSIADGATHQVYMAYSSTSGTLYVDGVSIGSGAHPATAAGTTINVGGAPSDTYANFTGTISHVEVRQGTTLNPTRIAAHVTAGMTGFAGDTSGARIGRIAGYAGITDVTQVGAGTNASVPAQNPSGQSALDAMGDVVTAEGGLLFINGAGQLTMIGRSTLALNAITTATVAGTSEDLNHDDIVVSADKQQLKNYVTATSAVTGAEQVAQNAASIVTHDQYPSDLGTLLVSTDYEALNAAQWAVGSNGESAPRLSSVTLDILTQTLAKQQAALALDLGKRATFTGMPSQSPFSTADLMVEGITETLSLTGWTLELNTSPAANLQGIFRLDDPVYSQLDSTNRYYY